jgi:hypothetical protein
MILDSLKDVNENMVNNDENFDIDFDIHFAVYFLRVMDNIIEFSLFEENGNNNIRIHDIRIHDNGRELTKQGFIFYLQYEYIIDLIGEINNNTDELSKIVLLLDDLNNNINNVNVNELIQMREDYTNNIILLSDYLKILKKRLSKVSDFDKLFQDIILVKEHL